MNTGQTYRNANKILLGGLKLKYSNVVSGIFIDRSNRFIANVLIDGNIEKVHVKNTGRCKEILVEGTKVYLEKSNNPNRKTKYSIISAYKGNMLINIDSQVPNEVVYTSILSNKIEELKHVDILKREVKYINSRFDLYYERQYEKGFIEVKGVTLENNGVTMFPDAPTERGTKHILELIESYKKGYNNFIFFLIQIPNINFFKPNEKMDPNFSHALIKAKESGVNILAYNSIVTENMILIGNKVQILL